MRLVISKLVPFKLNPLTSQSFWDRQNTFESKYSKSFAIEE